MGLYSKETVKWNRKMPTLGSMELPIGSIVGWGLTVPFEDILVFGRRIEAVAEVEASGYA